MTDIINSENATQTAPRQDKRRRLSLTVTKLAETNIHNVIGQGLTDAAAAGRDYAAQTEEGVRAARQICPHMTVSEALTTADRVR